MNTAQRILTYINENGIKQNYIASKISMDDSALNARLKGKTRLSADDISLICWALGKEPSDFIKPRAPEEVGV